MSDARQPFARYRVRLGFLSAVLALWLAEPTPRSLAAGAIVAVLGEAIRIWAAGHLEKGREVTVSGPYRFTRHPLYLGSAIIGVGFAVAANRFAVWLLIGLYLAATITSAIRSEERHLTDKFGSVYPEYRDGRATAVGRRFSLARATANREYRAVGGLVAVLALLGWKAL
ncbi:MAG TPA: isoprenylcysteine carboxylmethyltransferase family protein [Vicinamibacterales bacterium]|nr:isoprenylcysteine carboxylmethyltransferase family protein [Vicinamibacterales bacterium]